jgi:hypothetical protein
MKNRKVAPGQQEAAREEKNVTRPETGPHRRQDEGRR